MIEKKKSYIPQLLIYVFLVLITVTTLLPLVWMLSASFKRADPVDSQDLPL